MWYGILTLYWNRRYSIPICWDALSNLFKKGGQVGSIIEWILASAEKFIPRFTRNQSRISTVSPNFHLNYLPAGRSSICPLLKQFFWDTYFFYRVNCFQTWNWNFTSLDTFFLNFCYLKFDGWVKYFSKRVYFSQKLMKLMKITFFFERVPSKKTVNSSE